MINLMQRIEEKTVTKVIMVDVKNIYPNPRQPRHRFDKSALSSLAESIRHNGILQPLTIRVRSGGNYELIAGERRLRASVMAGYNKVPCILTELNDKQAAVMSLLENLQREDLDFFEEAEGIEKLISSCGLTQEELASRLGKNQSTIANKLRLLRLPEDLRIKILMANLTERHARALLRIQKENREKVLDTIIRRGLNVNETDKLIDSMMAPVHEKKHMNVKGIVKDLRLFMNTINNAVNVMNSSGIAAQTLQKEYDDYYEYIVKIPKSR